MKDIKIVQIGTGKMAKYAIRYAMEKGCQVIGGFDINPDIIGKDLSIVTDGEPTSVNISHVNELDSKLKELKPDVALIMTMSLLNDVYDVLKICASNGINVITTCEEAFDSYNSNPTKTKELDRIAKENNCTITGSGYQDVFWGNLISVLGGATHNITKIKGSSSYNVEDYGIALAKAHGTGLTLEEFDKEVAAADNISHDERQRLIENGEFLPSYMWNTNGWLVTKLGLTVKSQTQKCVPLTYHEDIHSETLGMDIKQGLATGMSAVVTTETNEGITIESECIGKVYSKEEFDKNEWTIHGEPDTTVIINRPATVELTCATVVNRIPDVINAKAGFVKTAEMDELKYRINPLNTYLK